MHRRAGRRLFQRAAQPEGARAAVAAGVDEDLLEAWAAHQQPVREPKASHFALSQTGPKGGGANREVFATDVPARLDRFEVETVTLVGVKALGVTWILEGSR